MEIDRSYLAECSGQKREERHNHNTVKREKVRRLSSNAVTMVLLASILLLWFLRADAQSDELISSVQEKMLETFFHRCRIERARAHKPELQPGTSLREGTSRFTTHPADNEYPC